MPENFAIITGTSGSLGLAYLNHFLARGYTCLSMSRSPLADRSQVVGDVSKWEHHTVDLSDPRACMAPLHRAIARGLVRGHVKLVHCVGMFKFEKVSDREDKDMNFVDEDVMRSNVHTFTNVVDPIMTALHKCPVSSITFAAFGSISDVYKVPFWLSYSLAKDALRKVMSDLVSDTGMGIPMYSVFINVSTVDTGHENKLRPRASPEDKAFWLNPEAIVKRTVLDIEKPTKKFNEKDVYEEVPGFDPVKYFTNHEVVLQRWTGMMNSE